MTYYVSSGTLNSTNSTQLVVETNYLLSFSQNYQSCILSPPFPPPPRDPIQLNLGLDHTNTTQDSPPVHNATAHSFIQYGLSRYTSLEFRIDRNIIIIITLNCLYVSTYKLFVRTRFIHFIDWVAL